ncbi:hypothetical protein F4808DRAFT_201047 [Astrocystis sublimbata]|nr:hypothetical protein F4808DRAFT_201047 [Astrocystis sublimbata]
MIFPDPTITPAPDLKLFGAAPAFCGYISGDGALPLLCPEKSIFATDSDNGVAGCVLTDELYTTPIESVVTSCVPFTDSVQGYCTLDSKLACCYSSDFPDCIAHRYTGDKLHEYSLWACGATDEIPQTLNFDSVTPASAAITTQFVLAPNIISMTPTPSSTSESTSTPMLTPKPDEPGGLSSSDKITLGTSIGLGVPGALVAIGTIWKLFFSSKKKTGP